MEQMVLALVKPGNRRRGRRSEQTEWCFETVRVVRNDLTVADVEMVNRLPEEAGGRLSAGCRARLLGLWWGNRVQQLRHWTNALL